MKIFCIFVLLVNSFVCKSNVYFNISSESCGIFPRGTIHKHATVGGLFNINEMRKIPDVFYIGEKYNRLTIISIFSKEKVRFANCICECGKNHIVKLHSISNGTIKSCGCLWLEIMRKLLIKYNYNEKFFISHTNAMYYVLGLFFSDGNLKSEVTVFRLGFKSEDKYMLTLISKILKGSKKLDYNKTNNAYELSGNSETIYNQLLDWGLTPKKSKTLKIPKNLKHNSHFWRGMIDGDGWISVSNTSPKGYITLGICGTINVCKSFRKFCQYYIEKKVRKIHILKHRKNYAQFALQGENVLKILNILYNGKGKFYLKRKYNKYIEYKNKNIA